MLRKIRAKDNYGRWIQGYYFALEPPLACPVFNAPSAFKAGGDESYIVTSSNADWGMPRKPEMYKIDVKTVCSAIKEEDGVPYLYEHDIVETEWGRCEISWNRDRYSWGLRSAANVWYPLLNAERLQVLGNMIDTPAMLRG